MKNDVINQIKEVYDPEIPINVYDLGLIYDIQIDNNDVNVKMTLTSPMCPVAGEIPIWVRDSIMELESVNECIIELTFDPPWNPDLIDEDIKLAFNIY